jgi:hypothetical protein
VQAGIGEGVQAQHPPETHQHVPAGQLAQRGDRQGEHQEAQRPQAQAVLDLGDGIGAQCMADALQLAPHLPQQDRQRGECGEVDGRLGDDDARFGATPRARGQNHFFRSMPAYSDATCAA